MTNGKNQFMASVLSILAAQIAVKLLGFLYRAVITNVEGFGDIGNGFYTAGFQFYILFLAVSSVGIPNAVSKLTAGSVSRGDRVGAHMIFRSAFELFFLVGLACSLLLYLGADFIALYIIKMDGVQYTLKALAPSVLFVCLASVIQGYFMGLGEVKSASKADILEQILKSSLSIVFVLLLSGSSAQILSAGANFAASLAAMLGFFYLVLVYMKKANRNRIGRRRLLKGREFLHYAKRILLMSVPMSLSPVIMSFGRVLDMATISRGIEKAFGAAGPRDPQKAAALFGMMSKSDPLINLPLSVNIAFSAVLVPTIAAAIARGDKREVTAKIRFSMLISALVILPCIIGLILFAKPIYLMIYPSAPQGWTILQISAVSMGFAAMNHTLSGSLQGLGKVLVPAVALFCGVAVKIGLNLILIPAPQINIYGAAISAAVCHCIAYSMCLISLKRTIRISFGIRKYFLKPMLCSLLMGAAAEAVRHFMLRMAVPDTAAALIGITAAIPFYIVCVLAMGILNREELAQLPGFGRLSERRRTNGRRL